MNKDLVKIQLIIDGSTAVIDNPSTTLKEQIGVYRDSSNTWRYSLEAASSSVLGKVIMAIGDRRLGVICIEDDEEIVVSSKTLSVIGVIAVAGGTAALTAAGVGACSTGVGVGVGVGLLALGGICGYQAKRKADRERREKDRMYREIIKKQQAAINRRDEINKKLEEELRKTNGQLEENQQKIDDLKKQYKNLQEVIDLLNEQKAEFKKAA